MAFGTLFTSLSQAVSKAAGASADRVIAGADWIGRQTQAGVDQAEAAARQLAAAADRADAAILDLAGIASDTDDTLAQDVKQVFRNAAQATSDALVSGTVAGCQAGATAQQAATALYRNGLRNAAARRRADDSEPPEIQAKPGAEHDVTAGDDDPAVTPRLEAKISQSSDDSLLYYGDKDNNIQVGQVKTTVAVGYDHDFDEDRDIDGLAGSVAVAALTAKAGTTAANGLLSVKGEAEMLSAKAGATLGYVRGRDFEGVKAEAGAEANLVKGSLAGQIAITPKAVYDNTVGRVVGLVKPSWAHLPDWADHGVVLGAEAEVGIGAAAKASAEFNAKTMTGKIGARLGAGPMAGLSLIFGLK